MPSCASGWIEWRKAKASDRPPGSCLRYRDRAGTGGVVACPDEVREPGKSGLAHQAKGFCPAWTTHPNLCIIQPGIEAMRIKYPKAIKEKEEELRRLEQRLRGQKLADRVRMLRLLKSEVVKSLKDCAPLVGYSVAQLTRWWKRYRKQGLASLLQPRPQGRRSRLTAEAWAGLMQAMRAGRIVTLQDARDYLQQEWDLSYKNGKSLWWLFKKQRVKWKTGRRRRKKVNAEQQAAFKKTLAVCSSRRRCSGLWPWMKAALA